MFVHQVITHNIKVQAQHGLSSVHVVINRWTGNFFHAEYLEYTIFICQYPMVWFCPLKASLALGSSRKERLAKNIMFSMFATLKITEHSKFSFNMKKAKIFFIYRARKQRLRPTCSYNRVLHDLMSYRTKELMLYRSLRFSLSIRIRRRDSQQSLQTSHYFVTSSKGTYADQNRDISMTYRII